GDLPGRDLVQVGRRNTGAHRVGEHLERAADHEPGLAHAREFLWGLDLDPRPTPQPHARHTSSYNATSVRDWVPTCTPADRRPTVPGDTPSGGLCPVRARGVKGGGTPPLCPGA